MSIFSDVKKKIEREVVRPARDALNGLRRSIEGDLNRLRQEAEGAASNARKEFEGLANSAKHDLESAANKAFDDIKSAAEDALDDVREELVSAGNGKGSQHRRGRNPDHRAVNVYSEGRADCHSP